MHTYTLTITKDDFLLEFKSNDKEIVEKELGVWINAVVEFLEETKEQRIVEPQAEEPVLEKVELGSINIAKKIENIPNREEIVEPPKQKEPEPIVQEESVKNIYKISDETKEILQRAIHQPRPEMKEILEEKTPPKVEPIEPVKPTVIIPNVPLSTSSLPPLPPVSPSIQRETTPPPQEDFTSVFNQKIVQENSRTDKFAQLLSLQNINNKFNCLIACAYHLVERENFERFTLKQINTISKALLDEAIEHDTLKEALERRLIKIVPDYTGIATTMEYTLTEQGIKYFENEIVE